MINKETVTEAVKEAIKDTDLFLVDVIFRPADSIVVEIDSPSGLDIDTCSDVTRKVHEILGDELDDYDVEIGSAGVTAPFKVREQYLKNLGNDVEVFTTDGQKLRGVLTSVDDETYTVAVDVKVKNPGDKRPHIEQQTRTLRFDATKRITRELKF